MVKKVTRNSSGVNTQAASGYVFNDELLDEILGEYDPSLSNKKKNIVKKPETAMEIDDEEEEEDYYEVEKILEKRQVGKRFQYLVRWVGFGDDQATWEPPSNLLNVKNMVKDYDLALEMVPQPNQSTTASNSSSLNKKTLSISDNSKDIVKKVTIAQPPT